MSLVKRFARNKLGRDIACGDVHGYFTKLLAKLNEVGFDCTKDRLFLAGDTVNRGPESHLIAEWLKQPWVNVIKGNHEDSLIGYVNIPPHKWDRDGVEWFYDLTDDERRYYAELFKPLPIVFEVETTRGKVGILHAECLHHDWNKMIEALEGDNKSARNTAILCCLKSRERWTHKDATMVANIRAIIVGHSPTKERLILGNTHYIDTTSGRPGRALTFVDLETLEVL